MPVILERFRQIAAKLLRIMCGNVLAIPLLIASACSSGKDFPINQSGEPKFLQQDLSYARAEEFEGLKFIRAIASTNAWSSCLFSTTNAREIEPVEFNSKLQKLLESELEKSGFEVRYNEDIYTTFLIEWEVYDVPAEQQVRPRCIVRSEASLSYGITVEVPWNNEIGIAESKLFEERQSVLVSSENLEEYLHHTIEWYVRNLKSARHGEKPWLRRREENQ